MIVKNESHVIEKTLNMLLEKLPVTFWVISDTGSTDNTQDIIQKFFATRGVPGMLISHEWRDFGWNRTQALIAAYNQTDYLLIFDADDWIHGTLPSWPFAEGHDMINLKFGPGLLYKRPLIVNNRLRWRFVGVLHEFIAGGRENGENKTMTLEGDYYVESGKTGDRSKDPQKYAKDAAVLEKGYAEEPEGPLRDRYAFYLAQSYKDGQVPDKSIEWYKKVISEGKNWDQEKYYSCLMIGGQTKDKEEAVKYYDMAHRFDGERREHIRRLAEIYSERGYHTMVNSLYRSFKFSSPHAFKDKLFVFEADYEYNLMDWYNSLSAFHIKDYETGYEACRKLLMDSKTLPQMRLATLNNIYMYRSYFDQDANKMEVFQAFLRAMAGQEHLPTHIEMKKYMYGILKQEFSVKADAALTSALASSLTSSLSLALTSSLTSALTSSLTSALALTKASPSIMLTMTTCKRLDLFQQTVNSILNQWTDVNRVNYWFCVDDNSCDEDRLAMQQTYPFFDFYFKGPAEKGHIASMNIIWNKLNELKPTYWIHLEDDFIFFDKMDYITKAIEGMDKLQCFNVKQVLFNRAYAEVIDDYRIRSFTPLPECPEFCLQDHRAGEFPYSNSHYWPHYSFRPSLIDVSAILAVGNFDCEPNKFFEMEYARRYTTRGYKSAFFNKITCIHIGQLTSERNSGGRNAYDLNGVGEFDGKIKTPAETETAVKIIIANLDRRLDRRQRMTTEMQKAGVNSYEFFRAVDGTQLQFTEEIEKLFQGNDFNWRRGFIGCALTHLKLWQRLLQDKENDFYLILEDDVQLSDTFKSTIHSAVSEMRQKELIMFGYSMYASELMKHNQEQVQRAPGIYPLNFNRYVGGTFAYSINKQGAQNLINYIEQSGIKHGIDYVMKLCRGSYYEFSPLSVFTEWNEGGKQIDSDIQNDSEPIVDLTQHFTFVPNLDQPGNDLYYSPGDLPSMMRKALNDPHIQCFNTLGFFKSKSHNLQPSPYFREKDGLYIKKHFTGQGDITIRPICNWTDSASLCWEWSRLTKAHNSWNALRLTADASADYYVVINKPCIETEYFDPARTVVFQMEPWCSDSYQQWGVKTWGDWAKPDESKFMEVRSHEKTCNNGVWEMELNYEQLVNLKPEKTKGNVISSVCSSKYFDPGHIKRIDFMKYLEAQNDPEVNLHIYNYDNKHQFKSYMGRADAKVDKAKAIVPYKYYFMCENNQEKNFITEKIWESLLCEVLCFYWGCPNIEEWLNPLSYVQLNMDDFESSYKIIKQALRENWYEQRLPYIRQEKERVLHYYAFMPTMERCINKHLLRDVPRVPRVCFIYSCNTPGSEKVRNILLTAVNKIMHLLDQVIIVNTGDKLDFSIATDKIKIIEYSRLTNLYEPCCLRIMHQYALENPDCSILYLHTKGISYAEHPVILDWIRMMLYFLTEKNPEQCLAWLSEFDTLGCNYTEKPVPHYSGNFWWATGKYISNLKVHQLQDKMSAEFWLNPVGNRHKILFNSNVDHYQNNYPKELYQ